MVPMSSIVASIVAFLLLSAHRADACSCAYSDTPLAHRVHGAASIVIVRAVQTPPGMRASLEVEETFRGAPEKRIDFETGPCDSCGVPYQVGSRYVLVRQLVTDFCRPWPSAPTCPPPRLVTDNAPGDAAWRPLTDAAEEAIRFLVKLSAGHQTDWTGALRSVASGKVPAPRLALELVNEALTTPSELNSVVELFSMYANRRCRKRKTCERPSERPEAK